MYTVALGNDMRTSSWRKRTRVVTAIFCYILCVVASSNPQRKTFLALEECFEVPFSITATWVWSLLTIAKDNDEIITSHHSDIEARATRLSDPCFNVMFWLFYSFTKVDRKSVLLFTWACRGMSLQLPSPKASMKSLRAVAVTSKGKSERTRWPMLRRKMAKLLPLLRKKRVQWVRLVFIHLLWTCAIQDIAYTKCVFFSMYWPRKHRNSRSPSLAQLIQYGDVMAYRSSNLSWQVLRPEVPIFDLILAIDATLI